MPEPPRPILRSGGDQHHPTRSGFNPDARVVHHRLSAPQEGVKMHHDRQGRSTVPVIGQQDVVFAVADLAGDITAAGLGGGRGS